MILYLLVLFFLLIGIIIAHNNRVKGERNNYILYMYGLLIIILSGFRGSSIGNDTHKYIELYNNIINYPISIFITRYEIGFLYAVKFLGIFFKNPQALLIISSTIIWLSIIIFLKKESENPVMSIFILITFGFFAFFMSGIRESIAIALCIMSFNYIKKKKLVPFILFVTLAATFHISAIAFIITYPLYHTKLTRKKCTVLWIFGLIAMLSLDKIIMLVIRLIPRYSTYLITDYNNGIIRLASILNLIIVIIIYYVGKYYNKYNENKEHDEKFLNLIFTGAIILLISLNFNLLDRVGNYFNIFICIVIPNIICNGNKNRRLVTLMVLASFFAYFICIQIMRPEWNSIYPYSFFWNN